MTTKIATDLADNASKLHKRIGELLVELYPGNLVRQELSVSYINPDFKSKREKIDWCILDLYLAIEINGEQHYRPVRFGGVSEEQAKKNLLKRQEVDKLKENAVREAGWSYLVIPYWEKSITAEDLKIAIRAELIKNDKETKKKEPQSSIKSRGFQKKESYSWPKRKLQYKKKEKNEFSY